MKPVLVLFLYFILLQLFASGQSKTYTSVTIDRWTLEKFPKHYLVKSAKIYTERNPINHKIALWKQLDEYGSANGLMIIMQTDFVYPAEAYYYCKGACVYYAEFFPHTSKASYIRNKNIDEEVDGPQIVRERLYRGGIKETTTIYKNGFDINEPNSRDNIEYFQDGLLHCSFTLSSPLYSILNLIAEGGHIEYIKIVGSDNKMISEYSFENSNVTLKETDLISGSTRVYNLHIKKDIKITNDKNLNGNPNYFYCGNTLEKIVEEVKNNLIK